MLVIIVCLAAVALSTAAFLFIEVRINLAYRRVISLQKTFILYQEITIEEMQKTIPLQAELNLVQLGIPVIIPGSDMARVLSNQSVDLN